MKVEIIDQDAFSALNPEALLRYLRVNGWHELRRVEDELIVFGKPDNQQKTQLIWMPISDQYSDYVPMVARLVKFVAEVEDKSELQLLDDLETIAVGDIIGVRAFDPLDINDHTLPLRDGVNLLSRARLMALASAASVSSKSPIHPRRASAEVNRFVNSLRLGQTERGSYIIRLISPIGEQPQKQDGELEGMPDEQPFSRRAVVELVRGLSALRDAADDNRDRGKFFFNSFMSAVPLGVSANLCEALVTTEDDSLVRPLEVSVTWSYAVARTDNLPSTPIRFDSSIVPFIRQAAKEFRARNPEIVTLNGWVHGKKDFIKEVAK